MRIAKLGLSTSLLLAMAAVSIATPAPGSVPVLVLRHDGHGLEAQMLPDGALVRADSGWSSGMALQGPTLAAGDSLGEAVAIDGGFIVAGAPTDDASAGSAHIWAKNQGGNGNWGYLKRIVSGDIAASDRFGQGVDIASDTLVVGAPHDSSSRGAVYVFERNQGGADNWGEVQKIAAADGANGHQFGDSVSIDGNRIVVGAPQAFGSGRAYAFEKAGGSWSQTQSFTSSDAAGGDAFGGEVSLSGNRLLVAADQDDG